MKTLLKKIILIIILVINLCLVIMLSYPYYTSNIQILNNKYIDASNTYNPLNETFTGTRKQSPIDKIDKILFINLSHRKDRLKQINNQFKQIGFPENKIQRINAVNEKYNGHIGCCKSHIKTMEIILENNYNYTMVFEDDFVFKINRKTFNKKLNNFFDHFKDNWDVIQLASVYISSKNTQQEGIDKVKSASTSSAYIINKPFVKKLLKNLKQSLSMMEKEMRAFNKNNIKQQKKTETPYALDQHWYSLQAKSKWYIFKPYIGRQGGDAGQSSIMNTKIEGFQSNNRHFTLFC